ncbi:MAG: patatin-like phospholipase family protein [Ardenticatenales bacterium]|nr:patatin-like phospholipase family protein [Ardenticatenales bacterium]
MWRPFFCVSVDLKAARLVQHRQGLLWLALRASTSLPGVFPPVVHEGMLLSDGSILNTLPADLVRQEPGVGFVVAVNVSAQGEMSKEYTFGTGLSGWTVLWNRLNPFSKRLEAPSLLSSLHRVTDVVSVNELTSKERFADLLIKPAVSHYGLLEFHRYEEIIEVGYQNARRQLETWKRQQELA